MRNSETIVNISKAFGQFMENRDKTNSITPEKNIAGPICYSYNNIASIDRMLLAKAAINKYFNCKPEESVVILMDYKSIKWDSTTKKAADKVENYLKVSFPDRKVVVMEKERKNYKDIQSFLKNPNGIFVADIHNFRGAQARNVILIIDEHSFIDSNAMIRDAIMRIMSFGIVIFSNVEFRIAKGLVEDRDLHHFINCERDKPICYEIDGKAYDKVDLVIAIIDKYFNESLDLIVILNYESNGKKLHEELKNKIGDQKEIVFQPYLLDYHTKNKLDILQVLNETQARPNTILITDSLESLQPFSNIIDFMYNTDALNHILYYKAKTIIIHEGDLEELNKEILQPQKVENLEEKMLNKAKRLLKTCWIKLKVILTWT